ncbi:MAG TPA: pirin family protein [Pyrinomonadaceae bacterium]|jgi:redox-sensitive bicupin YhaK (pirin superfamily)|nr:pirin family protein [Pyrinomonadaceae bacterium]
MITIRRSHERGHFDHGWLNTYHTFSFDQYYDPRYMGFRNLRVINEDFVAAGRGFPKHGHRDMEIITWILEGALQHEDSMGNGSIIRPGDVQRMTAGTGVRHSEQNASVRQRVHLLQIWILPHTVGLEPGYEQKAFSEDERRGQLRLIASQDGRDGSASVHQDVSLFSSILPAAAEVEHAMDQQRYAWIQVARGAVDVNGERAEQGDGVVAVGETNLRIRAEEDAEVLLFDLA